MDLWYPGLQLVPWLRKEPDPVGSQVKRKRRCLSSTYEFSNNGLFSDQLECSVADYARNASIARHGDGVISRWDMLQSDSRLK